MSKLLAGSKQPQNNSSSSDQQGVDYDFSRLPISFKTSLDESSNSKVGVFTLGNVPSMISCGNLVRMFKIRIVFHCIVSYTAFCGYQNEKL